MRPVTFDALCPAPCRLTEYSAVDQNTVFARSNPGGPYSGAGLIPPRFCTTSQGFTEWFPDTGRLSGNCVTYIVDIMVS